VLGGHVVLRRGGVGSDGGGGGVASGVLSFSWHGPQQYSSSQPVFVFTAIGPVTGPSSSSLVDVGSGEANADTSSSLGLKMTTSSR
jgi:hypothetical protein